MRGAPFCVCVPARNEEARLPVLFDALIAQTVPGTIPIVVCVNNSTDRSHAIVAAYRMKHAARLAITIDACELAPALAHVGTARGRAMNAGCLVAGEDGVLISTDADCRPPETWLSANLAAIARGADLVGGQIAIDEGEPGDPAIAALHKRLGGYWAQVRAIEDAIDPQPHDPPPRHGDHTGASLAIRVALYCAIGGVPALPCGEDRALVAAGLAAGGRLAHPIDVWTRTSARMAGRAPGGMATAMAEFGALIASGEEPRVPSLDHWRRRAQWRLAMRADPNLAGTTSIREADLPPMPCDTPLATLT